MTGARASILGVGTALPPYRIDQGAALLRYAERLASSPAAVRLAERVFPSAGISFRHTVLPDFTETGPPRLFGSPRPGTAARMAVYRDEAPRLAARAARAALASADVEPGEIDHLVVVTCTGFFAPGPDVELVRLLAMRPDVERTVIGFMGCYAAFNGLRVARHAVLAQPGTRALVVCVELCSLHFRGDPEPESVIASALFSDGASAVVVGVEDDEERVLAQLGAAATHVELGTEAEMGWKIGDDGFEMNLSAYVPRLVGADVARFAAPLAAGPVASWCVHPGGRAILDHVEDALALPPAALASSRRVLDEAGNLSSATVLFVLERELARAGRGGEGVMLGFGPGLTFEGLAFTRGARAIAGGREAHAVRA